MTKFKWNEPYRPEDPGRYDPSKDPKLERSISLTDQQRAKRDPERRLLARIAECLEVVRELEQHAADFREEIDRRKAGGEPHGPAELWQLEAGLSNVQTELVAAKKEHHWAVASYVSWRERVEAGK
jgi:hypothetical protein